MMRQVVDTNVAVSALLRSGRAPDPALPEAARRALEHFRRR